MTPQEAREKRDAAIEAANAKYERVKNDAINTYLREVDAAHAEYERDMAEAEEEK